MEPNGDFLIEYADLAAGRVPAVVRECAAASQVAVRALRAA